MAGEWIKMRVELHDSPKVGKIARLTGLDRYGVVGRLHRVWGWVDQTSEDGQDIELEYADIDDLAGHEGFADAMAQVGWIKRVDGRVVFENFREHNGQTSKRRAEDAKRKSKGRKPPSAKRPQSVRTTADKSRTFVGPNVDLEQEEEQEEEQESPLPAAQAEPPADAGEQAGRQADEIIDAVVAWSGSSLPRSRAVPIATDLQRIVEAHPVRPAEGPTPTHHEIGLALIRTIQAQPNAPPPSERARVRQYAVSVMTRCSEAGRMPGEFDPTPARPLSDHAKSSRDLRDFAKSLGGTA